MKTERSTRTLMTVFSGMAALLCLLVGLQLFVLEAQIGQAQTHDQPEHQYQFRDWKAQAHTGAVMSLGAGVLIFLFGLRNHTSTRKVGKDHSRPEEPHPETIDPDSLTIRVFEADAADNFVEISSHTEEPERPAPAVEPPHPAAQPARYAETEAEKEPPADPTDIIVKTIREAVAPGNARPSPSGSPNPLFSFWGRLFRSNRHD